MPDGLPGARRHLPSLPIRERFCGRHQRETSARMDEGLAQTRASASSSGSGPQPTGGLCTPSRRSTPAVEARGASASTARQAGDSRDGSRSASRPRTTRRTRPRRRSRSPLRSKSARPTGVRISQSTPLPVQSGRGWDRHPGSGPHTSRRLCSAPPRRSRRSCSRRCRRWRWRACDTSERASDWLCRGWRHSVRQDDPSCRVWVDNGRRNATSPPYALVAARISAPGERAGKKAGVSSASAWAAPPLPATAFFSSTRGALREGRPAAPKRSHPMRWRSHASTRAAATARAGAWQTAKSRSHATRRIAGARRPVAPRIDNVLHRRHRCA